MTPAPRTAIIIGAGHGLSASLARLFHRHGLKQVLAARDTAKLAQLAAETGAVPHACDAGDPAQVEASLRITAYGAFLAGRLAAQRMQPRARGTILLTGASAGVKGFPLSAPFAMGKFALRGLAQAMARELHPKGVHVAHVVIDGGIRSGRRPEAGHAPDSLLDPDAIAEAYWQLVMQPRSAWAWEIELRPWVETF
jgi:NADP-dependent 3-hydroxy acid dehydrogenase YdfG